MNIEKNSISVIIPTYNRLKQLQEAVQSVLEQTHLPSEIIIVNDGNKDSHFEELKKLSTLIKIFQNAKPMGGNFSRNRGAKESFGEILMFLDDDDTWEENKILDQLKCFKEENTNLVYSGRLVVYENSRSKVEYEIKSTLPKDNHFKSILKGNFIGTTSSVAVKKDVFFNVGMFDESLPAMQDYDLWIRICKLGNVRSDGKSNVRYTISRSKSTKRISNSGTNQIYAANIILEKYKHDFISENINLKKRKGRFYFYIAKSIRERSFFRSLKWIFKSFILAPSLKPIVLLFTTKPIYF